MKLQWLNWMIELPFVASVLLKMTAFLSLAWVLHLVLGRANPRWRVLLWRGVAVGLIAIPVLTASLPSWKVPVAPLRPRTIAQPSVPVNTVKPAPAPETPLPSPLAASSSSHSLAPAQMQELPLHRQREPHRRTRTTTPSEKSLNSFVSWVRGRAAWLAVGLWAAGVLALSLRFFAGWSRIRRTLKSTLPAPREIEESLTEIAREMSISSGIQLRVSDSISTPFLTGLSRPCLLLPSRMASPTYSRELRAVLAHELSHLRSGDLLWGYILRWLSVVLWFHPLAWRIPRAHASACEQVSDALAADFLGDAKGYSRTLARVALEVACRPPAVGGIPMARLSDISRRLKVLKRQVFSSPLRRTSVVISLVAGILAVGLLCGLRFAYSHGDEPGKKAKSGELKPTQETSPSPTAAQSDTAKAEVPADRGRIRGVVVKADTGEPIAGAYVAIDHSGDAGGTNLGRFHDEGIYVTTETDPTGRFLLDGVAFRDDHPFMVTHAGFVRHQETTALKKDQPELDVLVRLRPAGTLVAKVVDADGNLVQENTILRLEAEDGRPFFPMKADWPDLPYRTETTTTGTFSFGELDTGTFSIEAMRPGNRETTYHAKLSNIAVKVGETKEVLLKPADYRSTVNVKIEKDPHASLGERKGAAAVLLTVKPELLAWANRNFYHPEDERLGRVWKSALIMAAMMPVEDADTLRKLEDKARLQPPSQEGNVSFFLSSQDMTYTLRNFPPGEYAVFTLSWGMYKDWNSPAVYLRGTKAVASPDKEQTVEIPYIEPIGPSPTNARIFHTVVDLEAKAYTAQEICELLLNETGAQAGQIVPDSSIEDEKVNLPAAKLQIWDLLETIYLKKGWQLEADFEARRIVLRGSSPVVH